MEYFINGNTQAYSFEYYDYKSYNGLVTVVIILLSWEIKPRIIANDMFLCQLSVQLLVVQLLDVGNECACLDVCLYVLFKSDKLSFC